MNYTGFRVKKQNKFIMWCVMTVAVLGIGVAAFFVSKAVEDNKGYRTIGVVETKGNVTVVKDGIDYKAYPGMHLQEGHILVTAGESSARLVLDGDKYIKVESGSRVVFETLGLLGSGKTKIVLERGSMTGELVNPLETGQEFVVNTPNAVLAVRGTFFRVELENYGIREVRTNVLTYGGAVAAKRIFPTGETEEEEVLVDSGYKTAIHMNTEDTFYVLEKTEGAKDTTGDNNNDIEPIYREDITDDDWVDIYYSAENGHELFVTSDEAKKEIEERNISLENTTPIYEKAAEVFPETEDTSDSVEESAEQLLNVLPDDSKALAMAEIKEDADVEDLFGKDAFVAEQELQSGLLTDGSGKESVIEESKGEEIVESTEEMPAIKEIVEEDSTETETEGEGLTGEETDSRDESGNISTNDSDEDSGVTEDTGNNETTESNTGTVNGESAGGNAGSSSGGNSGGNAGTGGSGGSTGTGSGGTSGGGSDSGGTHTHTEVYVGSETIHSKCSTCGETLSTTHEYTDQVTKVASCTEDGILQYACVCGYSYEKPIDAIGHTPTAGGEMFIHSKCATCGETLEDGNAHVLVDMSRDEPTCTILGNIYKKCECGYDEDYVIPLVGHQYESSTSTCSTCGLPMIEIDNNIFPDEAFRVFVEQYDTDNDGYLYSTELTQVTSMNVSGGEYTSLIGIERFTQLQTLDCSYNENIDALDLRYNMNLETLNVTGCTWLASLHVSNTKLVELNVSDLDNLVYLSAKDCSELYLLAGDSCAALTEIDASGCPKLYSATFEYATSLRTVNMAGNTDMYTLNLNDCTSLEDVDVTNCGSSTGNFFIMASGTGKTSSILTGFSSHMVFQAQ